MKNSQRFVINSHSEPLFWSSTLGWTTLAKATRFTRSETRFGSVPRGATQWLPLKQAHKLASQHKAATQGMQ